MTSPFQTEQMTLAQLFDGSRTFSFPAFQRPYRWGVDEALTLLDDVASAVLRGDPGYFLGNLVMTQEDGRNYLVIDGRQRLTTLFILICILRDIETDMPRKRGLHRLVRDPANKEKRIPGNWRLTFQSMERQFVEALIASPKRTEIPPDEYRFVSERLGAMLEVADALREKLLAPVTQTGLPRIEDLTDYLLNNCEVIALIASSSTSGLRLFQVLNNRGLQLSEADLIKPDLLQPMAPTDQKKASLIWDALEDQIGAVNLDNLLRCYVFIHSGDWISPGQAFTEQLKAIMMSRGAASFHFEELPRYGEAFANLHWGDIEFSEPELNPNHLIAGLNFLGRTSGEWKEFLPVCLEILVRYGDDPERVFDLIRAVDRTFFTWFINETSESARRHVVFRMIMQMREGEDLSAENSSFRTPQKELEKALARLTAPFPKLFQRGALIRKVELTQCLQAGRPMPELLWQSSAEHIMPKNPRAGSQWGVDFTRPQHRECLDLLGNGIPLPRELDKRVGNKDFTIKKAAYERAGVDRYLMSVKDVCGYTHWKPEDIHTRTAKIADLLTAFWTKERAPRELSPSEDFDDMDDIDEQAQGSTED